MNALEHIRTAILKVKQSEMAAIAGVSQATVSRWETGELEPSREQMAKIRSAAKLSGKRWNDAWFFEQPRPKEGAAA